MAVQAEVFLVFERDLLDVGVVAEGFFWFFGVGGRFFGGLAGFEFGDLAAAHVEGGAFEAHLDFLNLTCTFLLFGDECGSSWGEIVHVLRLRGKRGK